MTTAAGDVNESEESGRRDPAARRSRLRLYQEQLLEKMQAARTGAGASAGQLGLAIGATRYLVDLLEVGEIVAPAPLTVVPLTQPWYLGLANVRGSLLGVIDLARYLGEAAACVDAELAVPFPEGRAGRGAPSREP